MGIGDELGDDLMVWRQRAAVECVECDRTGQAAGHVHRVAVAVGEQQVAVVAVQRGRHALGRDTRHEFDTVGVDTGVDDSVQVPAQCGTVTAR